MNRLANISRLTLGTAQLGMRYGIVNTVGEIDEEPAFELLDAAWRSGVRCFDTARVYGNSEARIGHWRDLRKTTPVLISKLPALDGADAKIVERIFAESATALGVECIDGFLCHRASDLVQSSTRRELEKLVAKGRIERFGVSVYTPEELFKVLEIETIGLVQLPLNLANSQFLHSGAIAAAATRGVLVFIRSIYLQGVLLTPPERLPPAVAGLGDPLRRLRSLAKSANSDVASLALAAVNNVQGAHSLVVGAETPAQLAETVAAFQRDKPSAAIIEEAWSLFKDVPPEYVDPSRWLSH